MLAMPGVRAQKISEDAYFVVDFNERLLVLGNQGSGILICYDWVPVPPVLRKGEGGGAFLVCDQR